MNENTIEAAASFFAAPRISVAGVAIPLLFALLFASAAVLAVRALVAHLRSPRGVMIIADAAEAERIAAMIEKSPRSGLSVIGFVGSGECARCPRLGGLSSLEMLLDQRRPYGVVISPFSSAPLGSERALAICDERCIRLYFASDLPRHPHRSDSVLAVRPLPLDKPMNAFFKRALDIFGSLFLIALSLPLMIIAAIGVRLSSPGPIIFRQMRVGEMGRQFKMMKFRSMVVNDGSSTTWSRARDPRKTRFGSFIRMTAIDELPQLFNILRGEMSLVGPRPEIPHFVDKFRSSVPQYMLKHYVKPGLTGLAQIRGQRGDTSVKMRIESDLEYIGRWSLGMDIAILLLTPLCVLNLAERHGSARAGNRRNEKPESVGARGYAPERGLTVLYAASSADHLHRFHSGYIEALRRDGYRVMTAARGEGVDFNIPFEKRLLSRANLDCRKMIRQIVRREQIDIIFLNTSLAAYHIRRALPRKGRPRVVNFVHGYLFDTDALGLSGVFMLLAERSLASRTDAVITMNEADRDAAVQYHLSSGRVYLTGGTGAELRPCRIPKADLRRELSDEASFVLLFVGELSKRKNQAFLIRALASLRQRIPSAVLWLVGDGGEYADLLRLAEVLGLSGAVRFIGYRENACDYIRACDLYVSASRVEGMPHNIIEALGALRPVLASDIKGHRDLISDGRSGVLYTPGNTARFVSLAADIFSGRVRLSEAQMKKRYKKFSRETVFDKTYETIKRSFVK